MKKKTSILKGLNIGSGIAALALATSAPALAQDAEGQAPTEATAPAETEQAERANVHRLTRAECLAIDVRDEKIACFVDLKAQREVRIRRLAQQEADADADLQLAAQRNADADADLQLAAQRNADADAEAARLAQRNADADADLQLAAQRNAAADAEAERLAQRNAAADAEAERIKARINNVFLGDAQAPDKDN